MAKIKGKAFFVVGFKEWGKSPTLRVITKNKRGHRVPIHYLGEFYVRLMSNDDQPNGFFKCLKQLAKNPAKHPKLLLTLCPTFPPHEDAYWADPTEVLEKLKETYDLFFFVLAFKWQEPETLMPKYCVKALEKFGKAEEYANDDERSKKAALRYFIQSNL